MTRKFAAICALAFLMIGCVGIKRHSLQLPRVRANMLVTSDWLSAHLQQFQVIVVHVANTREGYDKGHIPGALLLLTEQIAADLDACRFLTRSSGVSLPQPKTIHGSGVTSHKARAVFTAVAGK